MSTLEERLDMVGSRAGIREGFIAAVVGRLPKTVVEADDQTITTAGTNGEWMKFNRGFCDPLSNEELLGLYLHEAYHVAMFHMWRRDNRDPGVWNTANDAIINRFLTNNGYALPKGGVMLPWVTEAMDSDTVYARLKKEQKDNPQGGGQQGQGGFDGKGDLHDAPDEATLADIQASVMAAAQMAKDCGMGNSMIDRLLKEGAKSNTNWRDEVRAILTSTSRDDYSYRRLSRRHIANGLYLPSLWSEAMGGLVIGFDTSGSMGEKECNQVAGEIQAIADDMNPEWIEVVYCDTQVTGKQRFERGDTIEIKAQGGGGTAFKPVFDHMQKMTEGGERITAFIYLTDMEGRMDNLQEPDFPVVWGCVFGREQKAPFGTVVKITL